MTGIDEICTTTLFFITKYWQGQMILCPPLSKRWGICSPETRFRPSIGISEPTPEKLKLPQNIFFWGCFTNTLKIVLLTH